METQNLPEIKPLRSIADDLKLPIIGILGIWTLGIYVIWLSFFHPVSFVVAETRVDLPIPATPITLDRGGAPPDGGDELLSAVDSYLEREGQRMFAQQRRERIRKVESFFKSYGSNLVEYASIFVDKAHECGGSYRVLVGIAGSESGLGRINYMTYNPFGYLDGVQYANQKEALEILICKISWNHLSVCGEDLQCLVRRYAGPGDDAQHFVNKVAWFMAQV